MLSCIVLVVHSTVVQYSVVPGTALSVVQCTGCTAVWYVWYGTVEAPFGVKARNHGHCLSQDTPGTEQVCRVCRPVSLSACRPVCRSVGLSACLSACRPVCRPVGLSACLSACQLVGLSACRPVGAKHSGRRVRERARTWGCGIALCVTAWSAFELVCAQYTNR